MLPEHVKQKFVDFHDAAASNGILNPKTTVMIQLGAAMALGCHPCMKTLTRIAEEKDVSQEEIGAVYGIAMAVAAGTVFNRYREVCKELDAV
ncbi:MAG: carboxymuconolactone decarboxylase family protein [Syntrophobacter sp.]